MLDDFGSRDGIAVVTGGSGGVGAAIVRMLASRGSAVLFTFHRGHDRAAELIAEAGDAGWQVTSKQTDLLDDSDVEQLGSTASEAGNGKVHTLVHAAGPNIPQLHLSRVTTADFATQLAAEAVGFFSVATALLPYIRVAQGSIVAVTTAATQRYPIRDGLSAVGKGAVEQTVRGLAAEEGRFGVRVNCVGPGMLTDGMAARLMDSGDLDERVLAVTMSNIPLRRFGDAQDVAEAVCFLASDRADFISGQKLDVDGGYTV